MGCDKTMFSGDRYATRGIADRIDPKIQMALWHIIDIRKARGDELDYFQVFQLSVEMVDGKPHQKILNGQEQPEYREMYTVNGVRQPLDGMTIWVLDSGADCTMLFPDEY